MCFASAYAAATITSLVWDDRKFKLYYYDSQELLSLQWTGIAYRVTCNLHLSQQLVRCVLKVKMQD